MENKMASFDVVSKLDMQEVNNAVANSLKEIKQRYDFKGSVSDITLNDRSLLIETEDELKGKQIHEILIGHFVKRKVDPKCLELGNTEKASGNTIRQYFRLIEGIDQTNSKQIIGEVKKNKFKVQIRIQGDELRVSGSKKDDLQKVIELIRNLKLDLPVQFLNFRD